MRSKKMLEAIGINLKESGPTHYTDNFALRALCVEILKPSLGLKLKRFFQCFKIYSN